MKFAYSFFISRLLMYAITGFCLCSALSAPSHAESTPSSMEELIQEALSNNPELKFYQAEVLAAKGQRTQAGLWKNPELSGQYGERRIHDRGGELEAEGFTSNIALAQTFEFPGKGSLRKAIANKNIQLAELGLKQFRLVLAGQIKLLAYQYLIASENATVSEEIHERSRSLIELLQQRPAAGVQSLLEVRVIESSLIELQKELKEATWQREESRLEINRLLGRPTSQPLLINSGLILPAFKSKRDTLILEGLSSNLQLRVRQMELERAVKEVGAAQLEAAPDFTIGPFFSQDKAGGDETNFGVSVSLPLPLWNWNQGNVESSKARQLQAEAMLLDARRKVEFEIARQWRRYEIELRQLKQMSKESITQLREASELADRQYRQGAIGIQLYLEMQRSFLSGQRIRNEALLEAWRSALDLQLLMGGAGGNER